MNAPTAIPAPGIHAAIAAAMGEVQRIGKSERNSHGNYNFAGIDAFLDLTRPICAKHGLNVLQDEEGFEVFEVPSAKGPQKMLLMRFSFTVARDGESIGPMHRSIMVPASMGSQAFGSAQSYALKQFLRSLFQISTGEKDQDIDAHDTGELATYRQDAPKRAPAWDTPIKNKSNLHKALMALERELAGCGDSEMVYGVTATQEWRDFVTTAEVHAPHYLRGGDPAPPEFEGLLNTAERLVREFDSATAQHVADLARA